MARRLVFLLVFLPVVVWASELFVKINHMATDDFPSVSLNVSVSQNNTPLTNLSRSNFTMWEEITEYNGKNQRHEIKDFELDNTTSGVYALKYKAQKSDNDTKERMLVLEVTYDKFTDSISQVYPMAIHKKSITSVDENIKNKAKSLVKEGDRLLTKEFFSKARVKYDEALKVEQNFSEAISAKKKLEQKITQKQDKLIAEYKKKCSAIKTVAEHSNCRKDLDRIIEMNPSRQDLQDIRIQLWEKTGVSKDRETIIHEGEKLFEEGKYHEAKDKFKAILVGDANNEEAKKFIDSDRCL
ncbi:MAG: hypothetical protein HQL00_16715 [Nitrospirae bacterium]|nr:hypothetical protein [Nitrospirota bacterium]